MDTDFDVKLRLNNVERDLKNHVQNHKTRDETRDAHLEKLNNIVMDHDKILSSQEESISMFKDTIKTLDKTVNKLNDTVIKLDVQTASNTTARTDIKGMVLKILVALLIATFGYAIGK